MIAASRPDDPPGPSWSGSSYDNDDGGGGDDDDGDDDDGGDDKLMMMVIASFDLTTHPCSSRIFAKAASMSGS